MSFFVSPKWDVDKPSEKLDRQLFGSKYEKNQKKQGKKGSHQDASIIRGGQNKQNINKSKQNRQVVLSHSNPKALNRKQKRRLKKVALIGSNIANDSLNSLSSNNASLIQIRDSDGSEVKKPKKKKKSVIISSNIKQTGQVLLSHSSPKALSKREKKRLRKLALIGSNVVNNSPNTLSGSNTSVIQTRDSDGSEVKKIKKKNKSVIVSSNVKQTGQVLLSNSSPRALSKREKKRLRKLALIGSNIVNNSPNTLSGSNTSIIQTKDSDGSVVKKIKKKNKSLRKREKKRLKKLALIGSNIANNSPNSSGNNTDVIQTRDSDVPEVKKIHVKKESFIRSSNIKPTGQVLLSHSNPSALSKIQKRRLKKLALRGSNIANESPNLYGSSTSVIQTRDSDGSKVKKVKKKRKSVITCNNIIHNGHSVSNILSRRKLKRNALTQSNTTSSENTSVYIQTRDSDTSNVKKIHKKKSVTTSIKITISENDTNAPFIASQNNKLQSETPTSPSRKKRKHIDTVIETGNNVKKQKHSGNGVGQNNRTLTETLNVTSPKDRKRSASVAIDTISETGNIKRQKHSNQDESPYVSARPLNNMNSKKQKSKVNIAAVVLQEKITKKKSRKRNKTVLKSNVSNEGKERSSSAQQTGTSVLNKSFSPKFLSKLKQIVQNHQNAISPSVSEQKEGNGPRERVQESCFKGRTGSLRERLLRKLQASHFRYLNEQMYSLEGKDARKYFRSDPGAFQAYHKGYQQQVAQWPLNPLSKIINSIQKKSKDLVIADFGCGDALLSKSVPNMVHSFDLVALSNEVTACDMAHTPLIAASVDIVVFCLSLMGTNLTSYLVEANRVLKEGGLLKIAEVESRFENVETFIKDLSKFGFVNTFKDLSHNLFYFMDFKKQSNIKKTNKLPELSLKPCLYKKR